LQNPKKHSTDLPRSGQVRANATSAESRRALRCVHVVASDVLANRACAEVLCGAGHSVRTHVSAAEFLDHVEAEPRGCVLLEVHGSEGVEWNVLQALAHRSHGLPVVILAAHGTIAMAVRAIKQGAVEFLEKPVEVERLLAAVDTAFACQLGKDCSRLDGLTVRERQVLEFVVQGMPSKTIAHQLGLSKKTIDLHRSKILSKTNVSSTAELVRLFLESKH
jgi:two-component system, LuxR family, response regulator FixJ